MVCLRSLLCGNLLSCLTLTDRAWHTPVISSRKPSASPQDRRARAARGQFCSCARGLLQAQSLVAASRLSYDRASLKLGFFM